MKLSRSSLIVISIVALAAVAGGALTGNAADGGAKDATVAKPSLTVTTETPQALNLELRFAANGNVLAWQEAIVGAEANGLRIAEVKVNVGDKVERGQVLAQFAPELVAAELAQMQAGVVEAEADAANAAANGDRARGLRASGAITAQMINQYLTTEQTAKARLEAQRAALKVQQLRLQQTRVVAPDWGVISARNATVGAVVPAGQELFRLIRQGRLEWRAEVTAAELAKLKPGASASIATASGAQVKGKVRTVAPTVDPQTRSGLVYVDLPSHPELKSGMFAKGEFELGSSNALTVAQQSVVVRDGFSYVFRLGAEDRVAQVKVKTGRRHEGRIEILEGLDAKATVAVSGAGFLNDGDLVKVVAANAPTAAKLGS